MIVHCMRKVDWEAIKDKEFWGEEQLEKEGFIPDFYKCKHPF